MGGAATDPSSTNWAKRAKLGTARAELGAKSVVTDWAMWEMGRESWTVFLIHWMVITGGPTGGGSGGTGLTIHG